MKVSDICTANVVTVTPEASILDAACLMRKEHVGDVVCQGKLEGGSPLGILTDRDIVVSVLATDLDPKTISVNDAMSYELATVRLDDDLDDAIEVMTESRVRRVPVVDSNGMLAGVLSMDDVIGAMSGMMEKISGLSDLQCWKERSTKL